MSFSAALSTIKVTVRFSSVPPQFRGRTLWEGQGLPLSSPFTNLTRGIAARRLLEYPHAAKHYTFTNIHVFSGIRTQTPRHSS
ncbi:hypothetical protein TNCV_1630251 [Trichonephila clavipes]|uniref:Uncharacterized protein n=1 Tax=Trichonephila clavipes TaxID=2585209 RepID=A0A8X6VWG8_TRICX|nr:hypothetical protein TNCV_1630251 [Trichonephila clavipes]